MTSTDVNRLDHVLQQAIDSFAAGQTLQAIERLNRSKTAFPTAPRLWGYLGFLYGELGNDAMAVRAFRRATTLSPHSERASMGLFHSLWRTGKVDAAFREMRRYMKAYDSPRFRELLRGMLSDPVQPPSSPDESLSADEIAEVERA